MSWREVLFRSIPNVTLIYLTLTDNTLLVTLVAEYASLSERLPAKNWDMSSGCVICEFVKTNQCKLPCAGNPGGVIANKMSPCSCVFVQASQPEL